MFLKQSSLSTLIETSMHIGKYSEKKTMVKKNFELLITILSAACFFAGNNAYKAGKIN